jgi:preprotein translocase subunit SecG
MSAELIEQLVLVVHLLLALAIIGLIMLQQGKGADMGASFGAGASQTLLGSAGSGNVLTKTTAWMVAFFFATSFGLAIIAKNKTTSVGALDIPIPMSSSPATLDIPGDIVEEGPAMLQGDLPVVDDLEPALDAVESNEDLPGI